LGPTQAQARYVMTDPKKDAREPTDKKHGTSKQSREAERQRIVEEDVMDLREIVKKLRKLLNTRNRSAGLERHPGVCARTHWGKRKA
jgi:hypothetical protein